MWVCVGFGVVGLGTRVACLIVWPRVGSSSRDGWERRMFEGQCVSFRAWGHDLPDRADVTAPVVTGEVLRVQADGRAQVRVTRGERTYVTVVSPRVFL